MTEGKMTYPAHVFSDKARSGSRCRSVFINAAVSLCSCVRSAGVGGVTLQAEQIKKRGMTSRIRIRCRNMTGKLDATDGGCNDVQTVRLNWRVFLFLTIVISRVASTA